MYGDLPNVFVTINKEKYKKMILDALNESARKETEELTMKVSYNGFTGELVKLEKKIISPVFTAHSACTGVSSSGTPVTVYDLSIYNSEKDVTFSFSVSNLSDVKFLGGAVTFGE